MTVDIKVWGPIYWNFIHTLAYTYDNINKVSYVKIYNNISQILPCLKCKKDFSKLINKYPPSKYCTNRESVINWTIMLHNNVNKKIGKPVINKEKSDSIYTKNHKKLTKFMYFLTSLSVNHTNIVNIKTIIKELSNVYPCKSCKNGLKNSISELNNVNNYTQIFSWYNKIGRYIHNLPVKNTNIISTRYIKNQKVLLNNSNNYIRVISNQGYSTPGIKKLFNVINKKYTIIAEGYSSENTNVKLWIGDLNNKTLYFNGKNIFNKTNRVYKFNYINKTQSKIYVGLLLSKPKVGSTFYVKRLTIQ